MNKIKVRWVFQQCFNFNRIHDSVGKALRTADQAHVTANSHALSSSFHPLRVLFTSFPRLIKPYRVTIFLNGQFIIVSTCKPHKNHKYSLVITTPRIFILNCCISTDEKDRDSIFTTVRPCYDHMETRLWPRQQLMRWTSCGMFYVNSLTLGT
jgi:hypothetical protein